MDLDSIPLLLYLHIDQAILALERSMVEYPLESEQYQSCQREKQMLVEWAEALLAEMLSEAMNNSEGEG